MIKCRKILWFSLGVIIFSITSSAYATGTWIQINNKSGENLYWSNSGDETDCAKNKKPLTRGRIRVDHEKYNENREEGVSATIHICHEADDGEIRYMLLNLEQIGWIKPGCKWDQELWGLYLVNETIKLKEWDTLNAHGCFYRGDMYPGTLFKNGKEIHKR